MEALFELENIIFSYQNTRRQNLENSNMSVRPLVIFDSTHRHNQFC
jgi:hypothetical protein